MLCLLIKQLPLKAIIILFSMAYSAQILAVGFGPLPGSLKNAPIPQVPGLLDGSDPIIIDKGKAIVLGKALFWDINVGSDAMACASCHFHAGADTRTKNQVSPGGKTTSITNQLFDISIGGNQLAANYLLKTEDFPFHQRANPFSETSPVTFNSDDVVSSSGTFSGNYSGNNNFWQAKSEDECTRSADPVFHVGSVGTRKVEPRNAPTVINAIFNHRNFWDGRANNVFNGSSPWGDRDPDAGIWIYDANSQSLSKQRLQLINSSLASTAVAPPLSTTEMGCSEKRLPDLGRKLLYRKPLEKQNVHWNDSVLAPYARSTTGNLQRGLNTLYIQLIQEAFNAKYTAYGSNAQFAAPAAGATTFLARPYTQIEANFSMFFGLAIQMYLETLVADDSPFDRSTRDAEGLPTDLSPTELNGLNEFRIAHCALCHIGPNFTTASIVTNAELVKTQPLAFGNSIFTIATNSSVVTKHLIINTVGSLNDKGFSSTGVTDVSADVGLGGVDDFGNPLSFTQQYVQHLLGNSTNVVDNDVLAVRACDFQDLFAVNLAIQHQGLFTGLDGVLPQTQDTTDCFQPGGAYIPTPQAAATELANPNSKKMVARIDGAFKVPSLRNVELTGPYMHNGGMATLEQVLEFYTRGGNFKPPSTNEQFVFEQADLHNFPEKQADIIAFLKTLTDDRVRFEKAPFDHPELIVPHGHSGDEITVNNGHPLSNDLAQDEFLHIDAVGAEGKTIPLEPFDSFLAP